MKILLVEDEKELAISLKKRLIKDGFFVDWIEDGKNLINDKDIELYSLIILDWKLPSVSGFEICKILRGKNIIVPIIFLTAVGDIKNKIEALSIGADDYLTKPFIYDELKARINSLLRRAKNFNKYIFCKNFNLDLINHSISNENQSIKLTEKEFELLYFLINNKGLIINKYEIMEKVWGLKFTPETNFVEATIKNLRKKIEEISSIKCIKTIYGEGYVFLDESN